MTQTPAENPPQNVAPGNGPVIDYDKLSASLKESLKDLIPAQPATPPAPVANGNDDLATRIDALPEKIVNGIREAFAPATPPADQTPPAEEPKTPGKKSFREWWGA